MTCNQCRSVFDTLQSDLQAPGLKEREYTGPSSQSPGLLPQAPWPQVSTSLCLSVLFALWLCLVLHGGHGALEALRLFFCHN